MTEQEPRPQPDPDPERAAAEHRSREENAVAAQNNLRPEEAAIQDSNAGDLADEQEARYDRAVRDPDTVVITGPVDDQ